MTPSPGEIWLADIPFTDGSASKIRPVLVLWLDAADVVVAAVTSAPPRSATDVILADWQLEGLRCVLCPPHDSPVWIVWNKSFCAASSVRFRLMTRERSKRFGPTGFNCGLKITRAGSFTLYGDPAIVNL